MREYYIKNKEKRQAYGRNYYYQHKEQIKKYQLKNREKILAYLRKYSFENKERKKEYRLRNKERFKGYYRTYYQKNKVRLKERRRQKKLRVGAETFVVKGEIPVAAVVSKPLMSNHAAATLNKKEMG